MGAAPLCIIPARGGSKRFPRKNLAPLDGKPLLAWTIEAALASGIFDTVWVSSEDEEVLEAAKRFGGSALPRAKTLAGDDVTVAALCCATVEQFADQGSCPDAVYVLLPTSPFRRGETIMQAWQAFAASDADALMSVTPLDHPPEWALLVEDGWIRPMDEGAYETPRPRLVPKYRCDGGHIIVRTSFLRRQRVFSGGRTLAFVAPEDERLDVDERLDLDLAEFMLTRRRRP